ERLRDGHHHCDGDDERSDLGDYKVCSLEKRRGRLTAVRDQIDSCQDMGRPDHRQGPRHRTDEEHESAPQYVAFYDFHDTFLLGLTERRGAADKVSVRLSRYNRA